MPFWARALGEIAVVGECRKRVERSSEVDALLSQTGEGFFLGAPVHYHARGFGTLVRSTVAHKGLPLFLRNSAYGPLKTLAALRQNSDSEYRGSMNVVASHGT